MNVCGISQGKYLAILAITPMIAHIINAYECIALWTGTSVNSVYETVACILFCFVVWYVGCVIDFVPKIWSK